MKHLLIVSRVFAVTLLMTYGNIATAYVVDCAGGESIQQVVNTIGSSETIFIDGTCQSQGTINIQTNGIRIEGLGGPSNTAANVIEGRLSVSGAQNVLVRFVTIRNVDFSAINMNNFSQLNLFNSVLEASTASGNPISTMTLISSRTTMLNNQISATSSGGDATALIGSSNSIIVSFIGNNVSASAPAGTAYAVRSNSGSIAWIGNTDSFSASGAVANAFHILSDGALNSVSEPSPTLATAVTGDITIRGGSANLNNVSQSSGIMVVVDSDFRVAQSVIFTSPSPLAIRNSNLLISESTITADVESFLNSVVTIDNGSSVQGTVNQAFGSKLAVLSASNLDQLVCDSADPGPAYFVDVTSSITDVYSGGKGNKIKNSNNGNTKC